MSDAGYVRIYRRLLGHHAFRNDGEALAFAWMVIRASWQPARVRYKGQSVSLQRGQLAVSVRDLADALDRPKGWVERLLTRLKSGTMIETHSETGVNVITICNYDEFQADQEESKTPRKTARKTPAGQTQDTEQRREKGNKVEKGANAPSSTDAGACEDLFAGDVGDDDRSGAETPPIPLKAHRDSDWPELPDWLPAEAWNGWLDVRRRKGAWPTAHAVDLTIGKLERWRASGHDPGAILDESTMQNWTGIFEPKDRRNGSNGQAHRGNSPGGRRSGGPAPDGFAAAIHDRIAKSRSGGAAGEAGRHDAGEDARTGGGAHSPVEVLR